jgi:uncharacterized membrane protein YhhN
MSHHSTLTIRPVPAFTPYIVVSVVYLVGILTGFTALSDATKPLLVPALVLAFGLTLMTRRNQAMPNPTPLAAALTLGGLVLSWAGDVTLGSSFELGLGFFLLAHLCYISVFWTAFRKRPSWWGLLALPWFAGLLWLLAPSLGAMLPIVGVYGAVLGVMAVSATRGNLFTILGGIFFVVSDSMLAFRIFTPLFQSPPEDAVIMTAYLLAQAFIVVGILRSTAPEPSVVNGGATAFEREGAIN